MGMFVTIYMILWALLFSYSEYKRDEERVKRSREWEAYDPYETQVLPPAPVWYELDQLRVMNETERLELLYSMCDEQEALERGAAVVFRLK